MTRTEFLSASNGETKSFEEGDSVIVYTYSERKEQNRSEKKNHAGIVSGIVFGKRRGLSITDRVRLHAEKNPSIPSRNFVCNGRLGKVCVADAENDAGVARIGKL